MDDYYSIKTGNRASIAGRITDAHSGDAIASASVTLIDGPPEFLLRKQIVDSLPARYRPGDRFDQAITGTDGFYLFLNLRQGAYQLLVTGPAPVGRYELHKTVTVQVSDEEKPVQLDAKANIALRPTQIFGLVQTAEQGGDLVPVSDATVHVQGMPDVQRTTADGAYEFSPLVARPDGKTQITISLKVRAAGFEQKTRTVKLKAGDQKRVDVVLNR